MKKIVMAVAAVMVLSLSLLVGCGGGNAPDTLEGTTWEVSQYSMNGQEMDLSALGMRLTLRFENGQVISNGFIETADYTYENGKLTIEGDTAAVTGSTIHFETGSISMTLTKQ